MIEDYDLLQEEGLSLLNCKNIRLYYLSSRDTELVLLTDNSQSDNILYYFAIGKTDAYFNLFQFS